MGLALYPFDGTGSCLPVYIHLFKYHVVKNSGPSTEFNNHHLIHHGLWICIYYPGKLFFSKGKTDNATIGRRKYDHERNFPNGQVIDKGKGMPEYSYDKAYFEKLIHRTRFQLWMRSFFFAPLRQYLKGNVLDLGCGIGEIANYVESREHYFGLDINPYCVEYLQRKGLWAKIGSVYQIPLDTASMDVIILSHVLEHLEEPDTALAEISRVLKPSGTFIVIVPMHHGYTTDSTHRIFYQPKQLAELAQRHHYEVKNISIFPIPWEFLGELFYFFEYRMIAQKQTHDEFREG